jgi:hypothetical protein
LSLLLTPVLQDRFVQESKKGSQGLEGHHKTFPKSWRGGRGRRKNLRRKELFEPEVDRRLVVGWEAPRDPRELFSGNIAEKTSKAPVSDDLAEARILRGNGGSHRLKIFGERAVQAAADQQFLRRYMEVEPRAFMFGETSVREHGRDMGFVRRLVFRESRIAVDAIKADPRRSLDLRREPLELQGQSFHKFFHWFPDALFVLSFVREEPVPIVVSLETSQETEARLREVGEMWFGHSSVVDIRRIAVYLSHDTV